LDCNVARIPAPRATRGNITAHVQIAATYCRKVQRLNLKHISAFGSIRKSSLPSEDFTKILNFCRPAARSKTWRRSIFRMRNRGLFAYCPA
jgi:hypothetical protein